MYLHKYKAIHKIKQTELADKLPYQSYQVMLVEWPQKWFWKLPTEKFVECRLYDEMEWYARFRFRSCGNKFINPSA